MKRVIAAFLVVLAAVTLYSSYINTDNSQWAAVQQAASKIGTSFEIPSDQQLANPQEIYGAVTDAARSAGVNLFRTELGYTSSNEPETVQYVFLTGPTAFFANFTLARGQALTPSESDTGIDYLSTVVSTQSDQRGVLRDFGNDDFIKVIGLKAVFAALPTAGVYYVEAPTPTAYTTFMSRFVAEVNQQEHTAYTASTFQSSGQSAGGSQDGNGTLLVAVNYLLLFLILILLAYRQLYETKRIGVMALHGYPVLRLWFELSGRLILTVLGIAGALCVAGSFLVPGATSSYALSVVVSVISSLVAMLAVSLVTCLYISGINFSNALKNRKDTRALFIVNTVLKALCTIALIVAGSGLVIQYGQASHERQALGNWDATRNYGIFYPTSVGEDEAEIQAGLPGPLTAEVGGLYPALNKAGALYIDSSQFEPDALRQSMPTGSFRSLQVNPNYLAQYPIIGLDGKPVPVPETTTNWVVLAPEADRPQAQAITAYFQRQRTGGSGYQSIAQAEESAFGQTVPSAIAHQKVQIVWVKDNQQVFSFNPLVGAGQGNTISAPIIQVMTNGNSVGVDRENMITGAADTALKVHLQNQSTAQTLTQLTPQLRSMKLADNLTDLVTMNEYVIGQIQYLDQGIQDVLLVAFALIVGMLALIVQGLSVTFERFSRKIVVRSLFGLPFGQKYREFLIIFASVWVVQVLGALGANAAGLSPFSTSTTSSTSPAATVLAVSAIVFVVELLISAGVLLRIEKRRTVTVLKGEF
jgi:bacteriocin-associated integral membrane protein